MRSARALTIAGLSWCLAAGCSPSADRDATFQERAQRMVDTAQDAWFSVRERAIEGLLSDEDLDKMSMSISESLAFDAAKRDPNAPRFVRSAALQARRHQLDAKLAEIRARGLPDEPERTERPK